MSTKKGKFIVGRVDGKKLPSGFRRKRFHKKHDAEVYVILLTAQEAAKRKMPPGGYYVDGPDAPPRVTPKKKEKPRFKSLVFQLQTTKARESKVYDRTRSGAEPGQYIDVRSASRPEIVHHVYTGDSVNGVHCTCEAFHHGTRERDVLFMCKHIDEVVFGGGT